MAKVQPGSLVGEIRNKLGAQVFARNRYGLYTRAWVMPSEIVTPARNTVQLRFAAAVLAWETLLNDQDRRGWMALADAIPKYAGPVNGKRHAGRNLYITSYVNLDNITASPLVTPPDAPIVGSVHALTLTVNVGTTTMSLNGTIPGGAPSQGFIILAAPPLSPARYTARDLFRQIHAEPPNAALPLNLWPWYVAKFPAPVPGDAIIVALSAVAELTGFALTRQTARAIAT